MALRERTRWLSIVFLCLFVLLFFVHAKLPTFGGTAVRASYHLQDISTSQKMDLRGSGPHLAMLCLLSAVLFTRIIATKSYPLPKEVRVTYDSSSFDPDRFLRPPPAPNASLL